MGGSIVFSFRQAYPTDKTDFDLYDTTLVYMRGDILSTIFFIGVDFVSTKGSAKFTFKVCAIHVSNCGWVVFHSFGSIFGIMTEGLKTTR